MWTTLNKFHVQQRQAQTEILTFTFTPGVHLNLTSPGVPLSFPCLRKDRLHLLIDTTATSGPSVTPPAARGLVFTKGSIFTADVFIPYNGHFQSKQWQTRTRPGPDRDQTWTRYELFWVSSWMKVMFSEPAPDADPTAEASPQHSKKRIVTERQKYAKWLFEIL